MAWSATVFNTHAKNNCPGFPKGLGQLDPGPIASAKKPPAEHIPKSDQPFQASQSAAHSIHSVASSVAGPRFPQWVDHISQRDIATANTLFARAIHRKALPFSQITGKDWNNFFKFLRPAYNIPSRHAIGGILLDEEYKTVQHATIESIATFPTICLTLDSATNNAGKQVINMMACGPHAFFLEQVSSIYSAARQRHQI
jgi:hypothetical protein